MRRSVLAFFTISLFAVLIAVAQQPAKSVKRALPPQRWTEEIRSVFPEEALKELVGSRPNFSGGVAAPTANVATSGGGTPAPTAGGSAPPAAGGGAWSKIIDPDVVLAEIKSYQNGVAADVKSISEFNGGGYKKSRIAYSMLSVMFGVIEEYDGEIRFKKDALAARELFGRAGINLKVNTAQSFNESRARSEDLANLIRGDSLVAPPGADSKVKWNEKVANRPPLMTRLSQATEERLNKALSDQATFSKNLDGVLQEAQVTAAIAAAIQRDGYEHADDDTYLEFARDMQKLATEIAAAAKAKNYDGASKAFGALKQKCDECHGSYR